MATKKIQITTSCNKGKCRTHLEKDEVYELDEKEAKDLVNLGRAVLVDDDTPVAAEKPAGSKGKKGKGASEEE